MTRFLGFDVGTGGAKAVLIDARGALLAERTASYPLHRPRPGWAEQDPEDLWRGVCAAGRGVLEAAGGEPSAVGGLAFAGQMLSLVPLDAAGRPTRPLVSWLDARAETQARQLVRRVGGTALVRLLAGALPTGKDLVPKVAWIAEQEPEIHHRTAAYTDATGFLVARATGRLAIDPTAAGAFGLLDLRRRTWSRLLVRLTRFPLDRLPPLVPSTDVAGTLTAAAAADLGLPAGTPVAMGLADIPSAAVGSGAVRPGDAHVYLGTSSWIGVSVDRPKNAARAGIASVPSADAAGCLMIGESETAGACRDWLARALGTDDLETLAEASPPGARGLLFLPWMYGERAPVPDEQLRGAFVGLSLEHRRPELARALYEGVAFNLRWILDEIAGVGEPCPSLRAVGGGAASDVWLQAIADVAGRPVERVVHPQQAGALGSAFVAAVAVGHLPGLAAVRQAVPVERLFRPRPETRATYDAAYRVFRDLVGPLSRAGRGLAEARG